MFSQLRKRLEDGLDVVEQLAHREGHSHVNTPPQSRSGSTDSSPATVLPSVRPRSSSPQPGGEKPAPFALLSSLQRSLALPHVPVPPRLSRQSSMGSGTDRELEDVGVGRPTLEDRLKARFEVGEDSGATTPAEQELEIPTSLDGEVGVRVIPSTPTPLGTPLPELVVDPASIPLPDSPILAAQVELPSSPVLSASSPPLGLPPLPASEPPSRRSSTATNINDDVDADVPIANPLSPPLPSSRRASSASTTSLALQQTATPAVPDTSPTPRAPSSINPEPQSSSTMPRRHSFTSPVPLPTPSVEDEEKAKLRERLELVEQRFAEISTSFKRLQAERAAANKVLLEFTPVQSIADVDGLSNHLRNLALKVEVSGEEVKRLTRQIRQQEERMEELRDTHRLEGISRSEQADRLGKEAESARAESVAARGEVNSLKVEMERLKGVAKEEEEKRVKAISLLKTVRQKLVKAEREREDAVKAASDAEKREREVREGWQREKERLEGEVERGRGEREREVAGLRGQFEREVAGLRERSEREEKRRRAEKELEAITTKATYDQQLSARAQRISQLEASNQALIQEKDELHDTLQLRQAELESSQSHLETLTSRVGELQYQVREASERLALAQEEVAEARRSGGSTTPGGTQGEARQAEIARLLGEAERKHDSRMADLRDRLRALERERVAAEEEWSRNLAERAKEVERLRGVVEEKEREYAEAVRGRREKEGEKEARERERRRLEQRVREGEEERERAKAEVERAREAEAAAKEETKVVTSKFADIERQLEELRSRESQLRTSNRTLRDELRKVQSSAALLERGRNPGVGYWSARGTVNGNGASSPGQDVSFSAAASTTDVRSRASMDVPSSPATSETNFQGKSSEEEVNLEYLRNVILQFLEHKEMRPNLVRVLSVILHFTPQETRRLVAKV